MHAASARRRPLGRHDRPRRARARRSRSGRWPRPAATGRSSRRRSSSALAVRPGGHRGARGPCPRGAILDRDGDVLARNERGRERRAVPGLPSRGDQPGRRLRLAAIRAGRPGAGLRRRAGRAWPATRSRDVLRKFGADPYDPQDLTTVAVARAAARRPSQALGDVRGAVVMLDPRDRRGPRARLDADLRRLGHRRPDDGRRRRSRRSARTTRQPLLPRATLGRYVPGSVFKIVTAIAGLGSGAVEPGDDLRGAAAGGGGRPARRGLPGPRRPPSRDRRHGARPRRGDRGRRATSGTP